jgi:hypothetical protein
MGSRKANKAISAEYTKGVYEGSENAAVLYVKNCRNSQWDLVTSSRSFYSPCQDYNGILIATNKVMVTT